jgi:hypothetical protein
VRNPIILYLCCMVTMQSGYLTRAFNYTLIRVLHCSLIGWERRAIASQDHLALVGELAWRWLLGLPWGWLLPPHSYPEPEPSPLPGTLTSTLLWSGTFVMGLTRLSARWKGSDNSSDRWMTLHTCKWRCKPPSTHRPT